MASGNIRETAGSIITTKTRSVWFQEIADKLEVDMAISELTLEYNLNLLDGEESMSEEEMAEIMEDKAGGGIGKWWAELKAALGGVEKVEYLTAQEYYLAKRGEL